MEISDVRVKLIEDANDRLKAVCSITFDGDFVVRDVKVVEGTHGLFVAMPSRKLSVHCPQCRHKNHLRARFCNECGTKLPVQRVSTDANGRLRLHRDIAHPVNPSFRETLQGRVTKAFEAELEASKQPGYHPAELEEETAVEEAGEPGEPVEVTEEMTEYDALIAGLRSGPAPPRSESQTRPAPKGRSPAMQPAPRVDTGRRTDSPPPRRSERPPAEPRPEHVAPPRSPRPPSRTSEQPTKETFEDAQPVMSRGQGRKEAEEAVRSAEPAKPPIVRETPRPSSPPPVKTSDDDAPFGAGLG